MADRNLIQAFKQEPTLKSSVLLSENIDELLDVQDFLTLEPKLLYQILDQCHYIDPKKVITMIENINKHQPVNVNEILSHIKTDNQAVLDRFGAKDIELLEIIADQNGRVNAIEKYLREYTAKLDQLNDKFLSLEKLFHEHIDNKDIHVDSSGHGTYETEYKKSNDSLDMNFELNQKLIDDIQQNVSKDINSKIESISKQVSDIARQFEYNCESSANSVSNGTFNNVNRENSNDIVAIQEDVSNIERQFSEFKENIRFELLNNSKCIEVVQKSIEKLKSDVQNEPKQYFIPPLPSTSQPTKHVYISTLERTDDTPVDRVNSLIESFKREMDEQIRSENGTIQSINEQIHEVRNEVISNTENNRQINKLIQDLRRELKSHSLEKTEREIEDLRESVVVLQERTSRIPVLSDINNEMCVTSGFFNEKLAEIRSEFVRVSKDRSISSDFVDRQMRELRSQIDHVSLQNQESVDKIHNILSSLASNTEYELAKTNTAIERINSRLEDLEDELRRLSTSIREINVTSPMKIKSDVLKDIKDGFENMSRQNQNFQSSVNNDIQDCISQINNLNDVIVNITKQLSDYHYPKVNSIDDQFKQVKLVMDGTNLDFRSTIQQLLYDIETLKLDLKNVKEHIKVTGNTIKSITSRVDIARSSVNEAHKMSIQSLAQNLRSLETDVVSDGKLIENITKQIHDIREDVTSSDFNQKVENHGTIKMTKPDLRIHRDQGDSLSSEMREYHSENNRSNSDVESLTSDFNKGTQSVDNLYKQFQVLSNKFASCQEKLEVLTRYMDTNTESINDMKKAIKQQCLSPVNGTDLASIVKEDIVKQMLNYGFPSRPANFNNDPTDSAKKGDIASLRYLLFTNFALIYKRDSNGLTLLHHAVLKGQSKACAMLLSRGCNPNAKTREGKTPLHISVSRTNKEMSNILIENGANVNKKDNDGRTPLHVAATKSLDMFEYLLSKGASLPDRSSNGNTVLHYASSDGRKDVCKAIISRGELSASDKNLFGNTALHYASFYGHYDVCKTLVSKGSNVNEKNKDGKTPLHLAASKGHKEVCEFLCSRSANVNEQDSKGNTPLLLSCKEGFRDVCIVLLSKGGNATLSNKEGSTPLSEARRYGRNNIVELLRSKGVR